MALEFVSGLVLSPLLQEVVDRMKAVAADTINLVYNSDIEKELKNLEATYGKALRALAKIDGWDLIREDPLGEQLADIRRACYDAEDYTEHLRIEILSKIENANFLRSFLTRVVASHKLHNLQINLRNLITEFDSHYISSPYGQRRHNPVLNTEPVALPDDVSFIRAKDKHEIVRFLLPSTTGSSISSNTIKTVLITGMFGIGKTTLARMVMNDPQIQSHFPHRSWVSVLRNFDLMETLWSIITALQEDWSEMPDCSLYRPTPMGLSVITQMFKNLCNGRRILVVLDDLCNFMKPQNHWEEFETVLRGCSCAMFGVIITTRNPKVTTTVASLSSFPTVSRYLQLMSDEDCASIVQQKAYSGAINRFSKRSRCGKSILQTEMIQMVKKFCKGLPLVADIIGHRLSLEPEAAISSALLFGDPWNMPEFRQQIFPAFRLNYSDLSMFLRNCLPYFSLFPENYNFDKGELVWLWIAEGLIRPKVAGAQYFEYPRLEVLGGDAFDEVLSQSVLQVYCPFNQEPQTYRMHEFIHRYAQYIASDMYIRIDQQLANKALQIREIRHISFACPSTPLELWKDLQKCEGLRTILSLHDFTKIGQLSYELFLKLQWLRVLVLTRTDINMLPESLGELKHLGLLDVSETKIKQLPKSTAKLCGLLVLKLNLCSRLLQLPKDICNLTRLLYLEVDMKRLSRMPPHIGKLSNLQTLHTFKVGSEDGYRVTELKNMTYLKGSICLTNLENVKDEAEATEAKLSNKPFLKKVELEWKRNVTDQVLAERILAGFEPHENLKELQVNGYGGARFPSWLSSPECELTSLHILRCEQCRTLPALGQLQYLKALHIEEMHMVKYIDDHLMGSGRGAIFQSLESLKFQYMTSLVKWEGLQANQMTRLRDLLITDCPNLSSLPRLSLLTSLEHLEMTNCPALKALPKEGLPSSLETLIIIQCDLLKQRCLPQQGADWEKIKRVSNIFIDFMRISIT